MGNKNKLINCKNLRRFGIELELNAFDKRNRPIGYEYGKLPEGIQYVANLVHKTIHDNVFVNKWQNNHNNNSWIVKPDSSCGIEVCTPVLKGMHGIKQVCSVVQAFSSDKNISADSRCSFHVHVDVQDLSNTEIAAIICWWIKCEFIFLNIVPLRRKKSKYCQSLALANIIDNLNDPIDPTILINKIGYHKYYTLNTYHMHNKRRDTIEFRIMDESSCLNYFDAKNYILLLLHFIKCALSKGLPKNHNLSDPFSGLGWLDIDEFIKFLCFEDDSCMSSGLSEVKFWLYMRLKDNISETDRGIFGSECKSLIFKDLHEFKSKENLFFNYDFFQDKFSL